MSKKTDDAAIERMVNITAALVRLKLARIYPFMAEVQFPSFIEIQPRHACGCYGVHHFCGRQVQSRTSD